MLIFDSRPSRPCPELIEDRVRRTVCEAYLDAGLPVPAYLTFFHWRDAGSRALRSLPIPKLTTDPIYFQSGETADPDVEFWRSRTRGGFQRVKLDATHMAILDEQYADSIAATLSQALSGIPASTPDTPVQMDFA